VETLISASLAMCRKTRAEAEDADNMQAEANTRDFIVSRCGGPGSPGRVLLKCGVLSKQA